MLDEILFKLINLIRLSIYKDSEISEEKKDSIVEISVRTIVDSLKECVNDHDFLYLMNNSLNSLDEERSKNNLENLLVENFMEKANLSLSISRKVAVGVTRDLYLEFPIVKTESGIHQFDIRDLIYVFSNKR